MQAFERLIASFLDKTVRFTHARDVVPSLPLIFAGYHHFPREVWQRPSPATSAAPKVGRMSAAAQSGLDLRTIDDGRAAELDRGGRGIQGRGAAAVADRMSADAAGPLALTVCDGSGEDPLCHISACALGLCRSLADHLLYLGRHMYHAADEC